MGQKLDFTRIRNHRGTQMGGFEELCCQLAALEDPAEGSSFLRKGSGADQGLECYRTYPDGHEVGWQAKYFINGFESGQVSNLNDSLNRALAAHPQLRRFVVCLPIDLRDNRSGKKDSEVQRFEKWRTESVAAAAADRRELTIDLWSASSIEERLSRDNPMYSGRACYWFDAVRFSSAWFREKFDIVRSNLGERYSPESHVDLPIQQQLQSISRAPEMLLAPHEWAAKVTYNLDGAAASLAREGLQQIAERLREACAPLQRSLAEPPALPEELVAVEPWTAFCATALSAIVEALTELATKEPERDIHIARKDLFDLYSAVQRVSRELASGAWRLINKHELLISGPAGIGKSHLLADFGEGQLERKRPFILVLTNSLTEGDPWQQIRGLLDLSQVTTDEFLGALDAAAEAAGCRAVIAVDALNERHGIALWETRLQGFVALVRKFPRVALALTVRKTYVHLLPLKGLERTEHPGFSGRSGAAAKAYLDRRGIARPSSPNLAREFENPLFLRTCCTYLDAENLKQLPKGLDGLSTIFDFYLDAVARKVESDLKLVPQLNIPRKALNAFLQACAEQGDTGALTVESSFELLEGIHPSGGLTEKSLFTAFLSEGVLTQDVEWHEGTSQEIIRFTFERLSDHLRAKRLLEQVDRSDIQGSFKKEPLASYFSLFESWQFAGLVEALAVQIPEQFGLELFDVLSDDAFESDTYCDAFRTSLAWRAPQAFTSRTADWVKKLCDSTGQSPYGLLLLVSTEPANPYNADWLHDKLWQLPMPQRDATWSVFLAEDDLSDGGAVESLIDWAWHVVADEVDKERRRLGVLTLTWCLSTSNRAVRDRATKALVNLLSNNLCDGADLIRKFANVNDAYIVERLLAACYGAAMQDTDRSGCKALASAVWASHFADGRQPPLNLLARDFALGILLYAQNVGQLPSEVDLDACEAKFTSAWPLEVITSEDLEKYRGKGYGDSICSSTDQHGDFGNYTLSAWMHGIVDMPRALAGKSTLELFENWLQVFLEKADPKQLEFYVALFRASTDYRQRPFRGWGRDEEETQQLRGSFEKANEAFKASLDSGLLAEYTSFAEQHMLEATRMNSDDRPPSEVDHAPLRRWICERAHNLGWREELFDKFEHGGSISHDRMGKHRIERIGKKYQYIALSEVITRLVDNLTICSYGDEGLLRAFEYGPKGRDMKRDLDPSLLLQNSLESGWDSTPVTWWTPLSPQLPFGDTEVLLAWLSSEDGRCNDVGQIDLCSPDGQKWLTTYGFRHWKVPGLERRNHADAWSRITCLVTKLGTGAQLARELLKRHRGDVSRYGEYERLECFLGEHGWRGTKEIELEKNSGEGIDTPYSGIVAALHAGGNDNDNSIDDTFSLHMPTSGLMRLLGLRLRDGRTPEYTDAQGVLRWQDPSLKERGSGAAVVSRDYFLSMLAKADLEPVWVLAGEKNVYAGQGFGISRGFGGSVYHTTVYTMDAGAVKIAGTVTERHKPSAEQLQALRDVDL
ncbi:hypothetical protein SAMN05216201_113110 [Pseudomonas linyingensis]|uniref:Uncharacterized protein n=1 Tax=Pseudomonas linyingensis TaxID=915471 RepID=A0A1H7ARL5_9PSED|nr:ATP-binding protein [Pseudomonas linyingensis]SEJ66517.1 hypothetical protein SAMN05216201_113110 [Pseudomonas linyingensis]